ncbi:SpoIIE family protein phosphatase [Streptomyces sp. NPDC058231]|uniref:SpoIIE family protein phosphatase n=1 Tax=Streptomyces sp. NPDC058231 TaxID=3346392 RepID=UPI0036E2FA6D
MAERLVMDEIGAARLRMIIEAGVELHGADLLGFALEHAVTEAGGLGGMVHLRGPGGRGLLLMATSGIVRTVAEDWEEIEERGGTAPARAVADGVPVWTPAGDGEDRDEEAGASRGRRREAPGAEHGTANGAEGSTARAAEDDGTGSAAGLGRHPRSAAPWSPNSALPRGSGLLAVPLLTPDGAVGALSVLTVGEGQPTPRQQSAVEMLAAWAALRLRDRSVGRDGADTGRLGKEPPVTRLRQALEAIKVGSWEWDLATGDQLWDEPTLAILGMEGQSPNQSFETWTGLVHPDDLPWLLVEFEQAVRNRGVSAVEYRIRRPDGTTGWVSSRGRVLAGENGGSARMVGTVWDTTESRIARDSVSRALLHMSDAFFAVDREWRITFVNVEAERLLGVSHELLGRNLWDALTEIGIDAAELGLESCYRRAVDNGAPLGFEVRWPTNRRRYNMRVVPVPDGLTVYAADVTDIRSREAETAAAERVRADRNARITELAGALAEALTMQDVLNAAATRVMAPFGATGLVVHLIEGDSVRIAGSVGYPTSFFDDIDGVPVGEVSPVDEVHRTRMPAFIDSVDEYIERYPTMAGRPAESMKASWAFLPLIVSGRSIGCCAVSFSEPRHLGGEERTLLITLSGLMAQAIERARLFDAEHMRAKALQRGLLPTALPEMCAVTTAARYIAANEGIEVGGDWYDVIPLSGARVALVIGDVMGHGLSEAATMGRLRTAVHTLADLEFSPAELLTRLNDLVSDLGDDFFATCLYAVYDPATCTCTFGSAGHPPPAVVRPDGTAEFLTHVPDPPLGAARPPFETTQVVLDRDSLLVLYTDGLIESATRDIDQGMHHLTKALVGAAALLDRGEGQDRGEEASLSLERLCDDVVAELLPGTQLMDDAALLVARTHAIPADSIATWTLSDGPIAASEARNHVRNQLAGWQLDDLAMTAELLVSELVGNAVRYGRSPIALRLLRAEGLICEVSDGSLSTPRIRNAAETDEGGRGLQLVATLAQRWGARYTATGKCIWTEQQVP